MRILMETSPQTSRAAGPSVCPLGALTSSLTADDHGRFATCLDSDENGCE